jgi:DNA-binding NarL/FixJ family response regulator
VHGDHFETPREVPIRAPRVAVVAENEVGGRRLLVALARGGHCVGSRVTRVEEMVGAAPQERPDVVVMRCDAIRPQGLNTLAQARELRGVRIVLVVPAATPADMREAFAEGADGLVLESALEVSLAPAVYAVASGQLVVPRTGRAHLASPVLTSREKQVLGLVVMGFSNAESARRLHLAEATVKSHLRSSFKKLGVRTRSEACARILDRQTGVGLGILSISDAAPPE